MLSYVRIQFENGLLGSVAPSADGVIGLVSTATAVAQTFALGVSYVLRKLDDLTTLGITGDKEDANAFLYRHVKEFYDEAGDGAELWIMGVANTVMPGAMVDKTQAYAKNLIMDAGGALRCLGVAFNPAAGYAPTIENGVDNTLQQAILNGQLLAEWATDTLYAPLFVLLEARCFDGTPTHLSNYSQSNHNRVGILLGDTKPDTNGAAIGLLLGRIAKIPVQRHIGRVKSGALNVLKTYIGAIATERADVQTINDKGFITFRTITGKAGYFFADDCLATGIKDDYRSIARRRTIDKAYRIAYAEIIESLNDEIPITDAGQLVPAMAKSWESDIETAIVNTMGADGNLGSDPTDPADKGVKCFIDYTQNVVSTNHINLSLKVKPYSYAKYIDVALGFLVTQNQ